MRQRLFLILLLIPIVASAADRGRVIDHDHEQLSARHYILETERVLTDDDRAALAADGVVVQRALPQGRYIIRVANDSTFDDSDPRVRSLNAIGVEEKLQSSAYRAASRGTAFARLKVLFHEDTTFEGAQEAVAAAGGTLDESLTIGFGPLKTLTVQIPASSLLQFAADERVMVVYGGLEHRAVSYNAAAAAQSKVDLIQAAPYNLTGKDVVLSFYELAPADPTHVDFGGRLTVHFQCAATGDTQCNGVANQQHPTHVAGTMIAHGTLAPQIKGMAPDATLHQYRGNRGSWLSDKETVLKALGGVADNNSWGYTVGWSPEGSTGWTWTEDDELLGGYDGTLSAAIDHAALNNDTLMMQAAGNEAQHTGPVSAPFQHNHVNSSGSPTTDIWCYSVDGSGNDCPTSTCPAGPSFCEKVRHPVRSPFGSVNWFASEKNVMAVGATDFLSEIASFSSRGPAKDGRVKPEITAKGQSLLSTFPGNITGRLQGTSMSTPVVAGTMALFSEQWRKTTGNATARPQPVMLKALAIAGADDLGLPGPDYTYGFGFLNAKASADLIIADGGTGKRIKFDQAANGTQLDYPVTISSQQNLRFVLSWFDPETVTFGADVTTPVLINDLDLKVVGPDGATTLPYVLDKDNPTTAATRGVNVVDNNEEVEVKSAAAGTYHVVVNGKRVVSTATPQKFVLISTADLGAAAPVCLDATEPNDTPATAYGPLSLTSTVTGAICSDTDVDNFKFTTNGVGAVNITFASVDTPLTVTVSGPGITTVTRNIAANTNNGFGTVTTTANASQVNVEVKANGARGATGVYSFSATFPFNAPPKRRATKHDIADDSPQHDDVPDASRRRN